MNEEIILKDEQEKEEISVITDPFKKGCIKTIAMFAHINTHYDGTISKTVSGSVTFKNGDTEGTQNFKAESLGELLIKIYAFCTKLEEN